MSEREKKKLLLGRVCLQSMFPCWCEIVCVCVLVRAHIVSLYTHHNVVYCTTQTSLLAQFRRSLGFVRFLVCVRWCFHFVSFHFSRISFVLLHICFTFWSFYLLFLSLSSLAGRINSWSFCFLFGLPVHAIGWIGLVCVPLYLYFVLELWYL